MKGREWIPEVSIDLGIKKGRMPTPKHPAIFFFSISYPKSPFSGDCAYEDC
tara:strand:+ start:256 stop:408 length:153 start_codon:yes stop_codon:yes gene_type:complete